MANSNRLFWLIVGILSLGSVLLQISSVSRMPLETDEASFMSLGRAVLRTGVPTRTFDSDVMKWQTKDGILNPVTPVAPYLSALTIVLFGSTDRGVRLFSLCLGIVFLFLLAWFVREEFGAVAALFSVMICCLWSPWIFYASQARHFVISEIELMGLIFLAFRTQKPDKSAFVWWLVLALIAAMTRTFTWLLMPVFGLFFVFYRPQAGKLRLIYFVPFVMGAGFLFLLLNYWQTLPLFHTIDCSNRMNNGCEQDMFYYARVVLGSLFQFPEKLGQIPIVLKGISLNQVLLFPMLAIFLFQCKTRLPRVILLWGTLIFPALVLSLVEVKYPRYILMFWVPFWGICAGVALSRLGQIWGKKKAFFVCCLMVINPAIVVSDSGISINSILFSSLSRLVFSSPTDTWSGSRLLVRFARRDIKPDEPIIAVDEPVFHWYLDRKIYGLWNSTRSNAFFAKLIAENERNRTIVWFLDVDEAQPSCQRNEEELRSIDCRSKYPVLYDKCQDYGEQEYGCVRVSNQWSTAKKIVEVLRQHVPDGGIVVSPLAELLSFLQQRNVISLSDPYFNDDRFALLLKEAKRAHTKVFVVEAKAYWNLCEEEGLVVDCNIKYQNLLSKCYSEAESIYPACEVIQWPPRSVQDRMGLW